MSSLHARGSHVRSRSTRAVAAVLLCALMVLPGGLAETPGGPAPASAAPAQGPSSADAPPSGAEPLRVPDPNGLDDTPDLPVHAPAQGRTPLTLAANWTVLVYMVADNDLESFGIQDLNEMEAAASSSAVRVVVEVDRSTRYDTSNGDWTGTRRYLIAHDADASTVTSTLLADLGELNMGDPQNLADFLAWGADNYPAQHYLVDLWDHGYGWSGGFGNDLGDNDHLSLAELSAALAAFDSHLGRPLDILAFDACLMQQVDVAFEFAWLADFLVAAQDLEPAAGWPYEEMLAPLIADPSIAPETAAGALVDAYLGYYGLQGEAMMSATRLDQVRVPLANAMGELALVLAAAVEAQATAPDNSVERAVLDARTLSRSMFNADYIDLGQFVQRLADDPRLTDPMRAAAARVETAYNGSIVREGHSVYKEGLTGMSVYLPAFSLPTRYLQTRFANETYWDEFVVALLSGAAAGGPAPSAVVAAPPQGAQVARRFEASLSGAAGVGGAVELEYKSGWGNYTPVAGGPSPLTANATLDAGGASGPGVLTFRAVDAAGRPSAAVERAVTVVAAPVSLAPAIGDFALAVNRTQSLVLTATPRTPFQSFAVEWQRLPPGVTSGGSTTAVTVTGAPAPPFPITLSLTADATAAEGSYPVTVAVRAAAQPTVAAFLDLLLTVTRPLPDLSVLPLVLSNELPLPGETVSASTNISNSGFENVSLARVVATLVDGNGTFSELANFTAGPVQPGEGFNLTVSFNATRGTQQITVSAAAEPAVEELSLANNVRARTLIIVNLSVALEAPPAPVEAALGAGATPVSIAIRNLGTDADTYNLAVGNLTNSTWQVGLPASSVTLGGRSARSFTVQVLPPLSAEGGDAVTFVVQAMSAADPNVSASLNLTVRALEFFNATVRPSPNDLDLPAGGEANVTVQLQNTGNGHEAFALVLQDGDERLRAALNLSSFVLGPGAGASARLTLTDGGLVSTDRPYSLEVVAISLTSQRRFTSIVSVRVQGTPAVTVTPLEPRLAAPAQGDLAFHARVRNAGNTILLLGFSAGATSPALQVSLTEAGALLEPGASMVVNGSARFAYAPLAGSFDVTVRAAEVKGPTNASGAFAIVVPVTHDLAATVGEPSSAGPRAVSRQVTVENRGNAAEAVGVVVGYVPVGLRLTIAPSNDTIAVPARGNTTLLLTIEGPATVAAAGEIQIILRAQPSGPSLALNVSYDFAAPAADLTPLIITTGAFAAAAGVVAWAYWPARRKQKGRGPSK